MGKNIPIVTGNGRRAGGPGSATGKWLSSEFPTDGLFAKSMDGASTIRKAAGKAKGCGHVRDPHAWHLEGGKGTTSKAVKFQLRLIAR